MSDEVLVWVSLPYATYGLVLAGGRVVDAPPIARWMVGRAVPEVRRWLERRGAVVRAVQTPS